MASIKGFLGETLVYGFGNIFSRVFAMLLIPLYANYLGKIDYANLVMLQSYFGLISIFTALNAGVFFYYYEYNNEKYRKITLTSWFYYQAIVFLALFLITFFFSSTILNLFITNAANESDLNMALILITVQLIPFIFNNTNMNFFRIERKPKPVVVIVFLEALFTLILVFLVLKFTAFKLTGVVVMQIVARILVSLIFFNKSKFYLNIYYFSKKLLSRMFAYSWPFIMSMLLSWMVIYSDKFIGVQLLSDKNEVAYLALATQLLIPLTVLADMIRMALGPYVMSVRSNDDANQGYQKIFDLTIYSASIVAVLVISFSPILILILSNESFMKSFLVIPLFAIAQVISLGSNQFGVSFSLVKKTKYIFYSVLISVVIGVTFNSIFMPYLGFVSAGFAQILSYFFASLFLFYFGRKLAKLETRINNAVLIFAQVIVFSMFTLISVHHFEVYSSIYYVCFGILFCLMLSFTFLRNEKIIVNLLLSGLKQKITKLLARVKKHE